MMHRWGSSSDLPLFAYSLRSLITRCRPKSTDFALFRRIQVLLLLLVNGLWTHDVEKCKIEEESTRAWKAQSLLWKREIWLLCDLLRVIFLQSSLLVCRGIPMVPRRNSPSVAFVRYFILNSRSAVELFESAKPAHLSIHQTIRSHTQQHCYRISYLKLWH